MGQDIFVVVQDYRMFHRSTAAECCKPVMQRQKRSVNIAYTDPRSVRQLMHWTHRGIIIYL